VVFLPGMQHHQSDRALNKIGTEELNEGETMDCCPVCKGQSLRKVIAKALYSPFMEKIREKCESCLFGIGTKSRGSQLAMAITLLLKSNLVWVAIALDIVNAFNEIEHHSILEAIWDDEEIRPLWYYNMRCKTIAGFVGLGYSPSMVKVKKEKHRKTWNQCGSFVLWASIKSIRSL